MEGPFHLNEFAALAPEDLHFLRIFVQSEGRIRDMEAALGLSYPTIRTRLTALRAKLADAAARLSAGAASPPASGPGAGAPMPAGTEAHPSVQSILARLEAGALSYEEALRQIQNLKSSQTSDSL
jgi:hypothetical protein